jgi:hypothetical protein
MKLLLSLLIPLSLFSCSSEETKVAVPKTAAVLFFVDKTASVDFGNDYVAQKYQTALQQVIQENIANTGDQIEMYYVHENTAKSRCLKLQVRASKDDTQGMNATDLEAAQSMFDLQLNKEKQFFSKRALAKMMQANNNASNKETDLLSSISIINQKCQEVDQVKVYFFSDMVESQENAIDFHESPPKSSKEAIGLAQKSLESLSDFLLSNAEINVLLPFEATSSSRENNPNVGVFWQSIFEGLGAVYQEL